ncbi:MAG TPA: hypothetical protein VIY68_02440 [Steroidobacteraceae bacterium]
MTTNNSYLSLQASIICLLLALIGSMAVVEHPAWFGGMPQTSDHAWKFSMLAE